MIYTDIIRDPKCAKPRRGIVRISTKSPASWKYLSMSRWSLYMGCFSDVPPRDATDVIIVVPFFYKKQPFLFFSIFFPSEGNFDIDAGDHLGPPKSQKIENISKNPSYEIVHTSGTFSNNCTKVSLQYLHIHRKRHIIR